MMSQIVPVAPTKQNVRSVSEIPVIIEGCLLGKLNHTARPPREHDFVDLLQHGNVYIFEEHSSGIQRWEDGIRWRHKITVREFTIETNPVAKNAVWKMNPIPHGIARLTGASTHKNHEHRAVYYFKYDDNVSLGEIMSPESFGTRPRLWSDIFSP